MAMALPKKKFNLKIKIATPVEARRGQTFPKR
jgi:hypothetical protein